jgi:hypothetical protein
VPWVPSPGLRAAIGAASPPCARLAASPPPPPPPPAVGGTFLKEKPYLGPMIRSSGKRSSSPGIIGCPVFFLPWDTNLSGQAHVPAARAKLYYYLIPSKKEKVERIENFLLVQFFGPTPTIYKKSKSIFSRYCLFQTNTTVLYLAFSQVAISHDHTTRNTPSVCVVLLMILKTFHVISNQLQHSVNYPRYVT